jgi:single-strand DNA-binding protein
MNKAILMGRLTADPEMRHTTTGKSVCTFRLAVNRRFVRQGEEQQADFFPIVAWEKTAEFCNNYFRKGQQVAIVGRIQTRTWDDLEGNKRYITEIVAEEAHFAESKRDNYSETGFETKQETSGFFPMDDSDDLPF